MCHRRVILRWHRWGNVGKRSTAQGQVQIVLKCTNELGSGAAKEFSISAESYFVHFFPVQPLKAQLSVESLSCAFKRDCQGKQATDRA